MLRLLALSACAALAAAPTPGALVRFKAADGTPLAAEYAAPAKDKPVFVLLHGAAAGRGEWAPLAAALAKGGYGSLALDFRGHGDSGGPGYSTFASEADWLKLQGDVKAAIRYLETRRVPAGRVGLVGASIGANLAAKAADRDKRVPCLALLSPGIAYRGVGIDDEVARFHRPVFFAAAPGDAYAFESASYLHGRVPDKNATFFQATEGHGAQMLSHGLIPPLLEWIKSACGASSR